MASDKLKREELGIPGLPAGAPVHLEHLLVELNSSLDHDAPSSSYRVVRSMLRFLIGFFAELAESLAVQYGFEDYAHDEAHQLRLALEYLRKEFPDEPEARILLSVFYDEKGARPHSRLLSIGGRPPRRTDLTRLLMGANISVRKKCVIEVRRYLPFVREWLDCSAQFFRHVRILSEYISPGGQQVIKLRLASREFELNERLDVIECPLCLPERLLPIPRALHEGDLSLFVPQRCPPVILERVETLAQAIDSRDPAANFIALRDVVELLIRYFAGVGSTICEALGILEEASAVHGQASRSISASERLLNQCVGLLKGQPDSEAAKCFVGVFYRRNENFELVTKWHTEVLSLQGQLSAWCQLDPEDGDLQDPEVSRYEFQKHLPTLREWFVGMSAYLQTTEHFFEPDEEDGSLEFSVQIGSDFLTVGEPGYQFWVNNPRPKEAEENLDEVAVRPLIRKPLEIPQGCPEVLGRILQRMDIFLRRGEPTQACISLRDATDYLTRYYAGLAAAAFKELGTLPEEAARMAESSLSVHECERLLILSLESIGKERDEQLGKAVLGVFYYQEEFSELRPTGAHSRILEMDTDPTTKMQNLAEFCSLGEEVLANRSRARREIERFLPMLRDWLALSEPFFEQCQHFEEPPEPDGKTELVVEFGKHFLELVEPFYTFYIRPGADEVPDLEAPELPPLDLEFEEELLLEAGLKRAAVEDRPLLVHRVEHVGRRENSRGEMCESGYIIITNAGGGTLSGRAVSTHEALEVRPSRFRGNKAQLSYWLNREELPQSHDAFILLRTAHEERSLSIDELRKQTTRDRMHSFIALQSLATPVMVCLACYAVLYVLGLTFIDDYLTEHVGPRYAGYELITTAPKQLNHVRWVAEALGFLYLLMAWWIPVWVGKTFQKLPPAARALHERRLEGLLFSPLFLVALMLIPLWWVPLAWDPDFPGINLIRLAPWFIGCGLFTAIYMRLSVREKLDDWFVEPIVRQSIAVVCTLAMWMAIILGVQS